VNYLFRIFLYSSVLSFEGRCYLLIQIQIFVNCDLTLELLRFLDPGNRQFMFWKLKNFSLAPKIPRILVIETVWKRLYIWIYHDVYSPRRQYSTNNTRQYSIYKEVKN